MRIVSEKRWADLLRKEAELHAMHAAWLAMGRGGEPYGGVEAFGKGTVALDEQRGSTRLLGPLAGFIEPWKNNTLAQIAYEPGDVVRLNGHTWVMDDDGIFYQTEV